MKKRKTNNLKLQLIMIYLQPLKPFTMVIYNTTTAVGKQSTALLLYLLCIQYVYARSSFFLQGFISTLYKTRQSVIFFLLLA